MCLLCHLLIHLMLWYLLCVLYFVGCVFLLLVFLPLLNFDKILHLVTHGNPSQAPRLYLFKGSIAVRIVVEKNFRLSSFVLNPCILDASQDPFRAVVHQDAAHGL